MLIYDNLCKIRGNVYQVFFVVVVGSGVIQADSVFAKLGIEQVLPRYHGSHAIIKNERNHNESRTINKSVTPLLKRLL